MAAVRVLGSVVFRRDVPAKDGNDAQVQISVADLSEGQRYGLWLKPGDLLASAQRGQIVEVVGDLRISKGYANLSDPREVKFYDLVARKA